MPPQGNHTLNHGVLNPKVILAQENEDGNCLKKTAFCLPTLVGSLHIVFCRFQFVAKAEGRMDSGHRSPRLFPRPLSLHPPLSVWAHLDGWLSLISRGNSSPAAASSSCISTSALTEQLDSRAWNGAWEIRWAYPFTLSWGTSKPSKGREMPIFHPQTTIFFSFSSSSYPFIFSNISMHLVQLETQSSRPHLD